MNILVAQFKPSEGEKQSGNQWDFHLLDEEPI